MLEELHVMIDLETLAKSTESVILAVGFAVFETQGSVVNQSGVWNLRLKSQLHKGTRQREVDEDTLVNFWMKQPQEARELAFLALPKVDCIEFISDFKERIQWHNIQGVWAKGLHFDIPMLEHLHQQHNDTVPWHYRTPRDLRTLTWLAGMHSGDYVKPIIPHSAEHDAIAQALTVQMALKRLQAIAQNSDGGW